MFQSLILTILWSIASATSGVPAYQQYTRDRWELIYARLLPNDMEICGGNGSQLTVFHGFPDAGNSLLIHNQGSIAETSIDPDAIGSYIEGLAGQFGGLQSLHFKVLRNWASAEFYRVLEERGFEDTELSTIMTLDIIDDLKAQRPLSSEYMMGMVDSYEDILGIAEFHGSMIEWALRRMSPSIAHEQTLRFWQVVHKESNELACTLLVEIVNGIAGIQMVETSPSHRRRGLATALMFEAVRSAFIDSGVQCVVLGATPMAVSLYARLGFQVHGHYNSYEYLNT